MILNTLFSGTNDSSDPTQATVAVGACWDYSNNYTVLTRLTPDTDPYNLVNTVPTNEPVAAIGTGAGSSPFDFIMPWAGMEEYNILPDGSAIKSGEDGFSRTDNDTMVYIPEFWFAVKDDASGKKRYLYIADKQADGFEKHPGSRRFVGRYNTGTGYVSKSGLAPLTDITRAAARTGSTNKGDGWYQYDFATWCAIGLLYVVEYADWNSQSTIGAGITSGSKSNSGLSDSMKYHTGTAGAARTTATAAVQYRHIENPFGNVYDWVDGFDANNRAAYVCTDPDKYTDGSATNYTATGITMPSSNWITGLGYSEAAPWVIIPSAASGGSGSTYITDRMYSNTGWMALRVGGIYDYATGAGLFCFGANSAASGSSANIGARLLYIP